MKRILAMAAILLLAAGASFAQSAAGGSKGATGFSVTFVVNPPTAAIFVDGAQIKGTVATVSAGSHAVRVTAPGFQDFSATISVTGNMSLPITLKPSSIQLSVNAANVKGAQVLVNGKAVGTTPYTGQLPAGTYSVTIQAPGYQPYSESVNLTGSRTINVTLQQATVQLSVNASNVRGAQVLLNGAAVGVTPYTVQLAMGTYSVTIQAPGYLPYTESVNLTGPRTINATLQPATFLLSVNAANVKGAQVLVNGSVVGTTPFDGNLAAGNYAVTIQAPGYFPYNENIQLTAPRAINVNLIPATYLLSVNALNVRGAQVTLNGSLSGTTPYSAQMAQGSYTVVIQAPGYYPYAETVNLTEARTIAVNLVPSTASVTITLPANNINAGLGGNHWEHIQVFVDGVVQKGTVVQVQPGKRLLRIVAGGMQIEMFYEFEAGKSYTIEPFMGLNIKDK